MTENADIEADQHPRLRNRVGYVARRFNQAIRTRVDEGLRPLGLTASQYAVLAMLETFSGSTNAQLARALSVTPQTMTRILGGLIDNGLAERGVSSHHARVRPAHLTPRGQDLVTRAHLVVDAAEDLLFAPLSTEQRTQFLDQMWACAAASPRSAVFEEF